ncbi:MAG: protein kinase [Rubripirellula sp.]
MPKPTHPAVERFVEAMTAQYVSEVSKSGSAASNIDEFASSIEQTVKATLRARLSVLDTKQDQDPSLHVTIDSESALNQSGQMPTLNTNVSGITDALTGITANQFVSAKHHSDHDTMDSDPRPLSVKNAVRRGQKESEATPKAPQDYEFLGTLGKGGMGIVYQARHVPLNRTVAIKMILSGAHASAEQLRRFRQEAESAARLTHPNIVSVHEVGEHEGLPFFSLEYVDGHSVSTLMKQSTLSATDAAELLVPVSRAVHYSHQQGVLHRDLKPQNILLTKTGVPKVADFGLAKRLDAEEDDQKTREGVIIGTPGYMAPEQARAGKPVGPYSDVYALGCILYYMMTGRPPFKAPTAFETVRQSLSQDPVSPSKLQTGLDMDLETICLKALEKDVNKRYQTAADFADELQRFLDGKPIMARPITRPERLSKWCKRNPRVAMLSGLAASLLLCLLLGGIVTSVIMNQQRIAEKAARKNAQASEQRAKASSKIADDQAELALDTTRLILYQAKDFFEGKPELVPLRKTMLDSIVAGVEKIHAERYDTDLQTTFVASADCQLGQIYLEVGEFQKARDKLLESQRKLIVLNKEGKLSRADVSQMNISLALGDAYQKLGDAEAAKEQFLNLLEQRTKYFSKAPSKLNPIVVGESMSVAYGKLGGIYSELGKPEEALKYGIKGVEARRQAFNHKPNSFQAAAHLASALSNLSEMHERAGETEKMLETSSEAMELQTRLANIRSDVATLHNTAMKQKTVARQYLLLGKNQEAQTLLNQATATFSGLMKRAGDNQKVISQTVDAYYWQGAVEQSLKKDPAESYDRAVELQRKLIAKSDNVNTQGMLLKILARAGKIEEALKIADRLASDDANMHHCGYAACGYALAAVHAKPPQQTELIDKAIQYVGKLVDHGYHDFESLRKTDLDFAPLQSHAAFQSMLDEKEKSIRRSDSAKESD